VNINEELLESRKSRLTLTTRDNLYPQKLALTSKTCGDRSVCIVRSRTKATEFSLVFFFYLIWYYAMKTCGWKNIQTRSILNFHTRWGWVLSITLQLSCSWKRGSPIHLGKRDWVNPRAGVDTTTNTLPGNEPQSSSLYGRIYWPTPPDNRL
jgi:hypothetical protein